MIFQRIFKSLRDGNMTIIRDGINYSNELLFKVKKEQENQYDNNDYSALMYLNKEAFYEVGYEGGEYYKSWEVILTAPQQYVGLFQKQEGLNMKKWFLSDPTLVKLWYDIIEKYQNKDFSRNTFDDFRFLLEMFLKNVLKNSKSIENQKVPLGVFLKEHHINVHIRTSIVAELDHFCKYQNNNVKHSNTYKDNDIDYVYNTVVKIIGCCINALKNKAQTHNNKYRSFGG